MPANTSSQAATDVVRIGQIGAGRNGSGHVRALMKKADAKVVAVADPVKEAADSLAEEADARACTDFREMLDEVDAVVISSPSFLHLEQFAAVAEAGKAVLLEKPIATTRADAVAVARIAERTGVPSLVGFSPRFSPFVREALARHADGSLGKLRSVTARRHCYLHPDKVGAWLLDGNVSGGMMLEMNIHEIDWMMALAGPVRTVDARVSLEDPAFPRMADHSFALLDFESGASGIHDGSWKSPMPNFLKAVVGEKAGMGSDEWGNTVYFAPVGENRQTLDAKPMDRHDHFLDIVAGRARSECDIAWALQVHIVVEAILESSFRKQPVDVAAFREEMLSA